MLYQGIHMLSVQGILLKRHKISGTSGRQLAPEDLQIGQTVTAYGRVYHITSVDAFTRQHLAERGITVAPDEQIPACPYDAWLATHNTPGEPSAGHRNLKFPSLGYPGGPHSPCAAMRAACPEFLWHSPRTTKVIGCLTTGRRFCLTYGYEDIQSLSDEIQEWLSGCQVKFKSGQDLLHACVGSPLRSSALTNTLSGVRTHTGSMKHIEDCGKVS